VLIAQLPSEKSGQSLSVSVCSQLAQTLTHIEEWKLMHLTRRKCGLITKADIIIGSREKITAIVEPNVLDDCGIRLGKVAQITRRRPPGIIQSRKTTSILSAEMLMESLESL
jgi:hypothetical protein